MKLRYYLRGLGIGVVVTAFIMSQTSKTEEMTDAQIKIRALELGMVEETVLAKLPQAVADEQENTDSHFDYTAGEAEILEQDESETEKTVENVSDEITETEEKNSETSEEIENQLDNLTTTEDATGVTSNNEELQQDVQTNTESQEERTEQYIIIAVEPGNGSETISRKLYNAGLVESAIEYNRFLVENGYDRILSVGNHEIPVGASEEEMAKILCGLQ